MDITLDFFIIKLCFLLILEVLGNEDKGFTDENKTWLKPVQKKANKREKKQLLESDDDDDDEEEEVQFDSEEKSEGSDPGFDGEQMDTDEDEMEENDEDGMGENDEDDKGGKLKVRK